MSTYANKVCHWTPTIFNNKVWQQGGYRLLAYINDIINVVTAN